MIGEMNSLKSVIGFPFFSEFLIFDLFMSLRRYVIAGTKIQWKSFLSFEDKNNFRRGLLSKNFCGGALSTFTLFQTKIYMGCWPSVTAYVIYFPRGVTKGGAATSLLDSWQKSGVMWYLPLKKKKENRVH